MDENITGIPTRSADGRAALDVFYGEFNDVNFYVEDADQENLYETLLRKLFPSLRIARVFPLSGKKAVLQHAAAPENQESNPRRIYVLDKDFDDLLGTNVADHRVIYLDRFCIENYLVEEAAVVEVVVENHPKKKRGDVETALSLPTLVEQCLSDLRPLFLLFFCVQRFDLGLKNCSSKPEQFCKSERLWIINAEAISQYLESVKEAAFYKGVSPPLVDPWGDERLRPIHDADVHAIIAGKFLLTMIFHYIKSRFSMGSITFDSFRFRVAKNCDTASLSTVRSRIEEALALQA